VATSRTAFATGSRWFCDRREELKPSFTFVIVAKSKAGQVLCRLELEGHDPDHTDCWPLPRWERCKPDCYHGLTQTYSHKHLKKYARLLEKPE